MDMWIDAVMEGGINREMYAGIDGRKGQGMGSMGDGGTNRKMDGKIYVGMDGEMDR